VSRLFFQFLGSGHNCTALFFSSLGPFQFAHLQENGSPVDLQAGPAAGLQPGPNPCQPLERREQQDPLRPRRSFTAADSDGNMMNWLTHEFPSGKRICIHVQVWPVPVPLTGFSLNLNRAPRIAQFRRTSVYTHTDRIGTDWIAAMTEMELIMVGRSVGWSGCRRRLGQS